MTDGHDGTDHDNCPPQDPTPWSAPSTPSAPPPPPAFPPPAGGPVLPPPSGPAYAGDPFATPAPPRPRRRGLVIAGVLAGVVVLAGVGYAAVRALSGVLSDVVSSANAPATPGDEAYIGDLRAGDCFSRAADEQGKDLVSYVDVRSCTEPHDAQVYAVVPLTFDTYPGDDALGTAGDDGCSAQEGVLDPAVKVESDVAPRWYAPDADTWDTDEHEAACTVESLSPGGLTRSWMAATASGSPQPTSS